MGGTLLALAGLLALTASVTPAQAAGFVYVTTTVPGINIDDECSLQEATIDIHPIGHRVGEPGLAHQARQPATTIATCGPPAADTLRLDLGAQTVDLS